MDNGDRRYGAMGSALRSPLPTPTQLAFKTEENRTNTGVEHTTFALAEIFG
jgi:hypothetical protein